MKLKSRQRHLRHQKHRLHLKQTHPHPRGSTLLIVMVLMGMLSLLGVIFYVFSAQERSNAEYYSEGSKETSDPGLDADVLFDWALEQIIVGTDSRLKNSVLWGSRHSLLSNAVGFSNHRPDPSAQPFNGEGVNVIYDSATGKLGVDQNRNGLIDDPTVNAGEPDNRFLLNFVDSPAASPTLFEPQLTNGGWPQTDVGYTYPDINNVFLCYVGKVRDNNGVVHQVVKPSYMVPGLFRAAATSAPNASWYNDPNTAQQVMRGHPNHYYVPPTASPANPAPRYLTNAQAASVIGPGATGFPGIPMNGTFPVLGTSLGRIGAYSVVDISGTYPPNEPVELDYDNDGDGICESILMDLDFPPQQDAKGKLFVPLFLITIHDLDSLLNLNVHGNLAKILYGPTDISNGLATTAVASGGSGNWFGTDSADGKFYFVSQSNLGLGPAEINPIWALNRRIGVDDTFTFTEHQNFFGNAPTAVTSGTSPSWGESGNMEFLWSKIGRFQKSPFDLFVGAYGEPAVLYAATNNGSGPVNSTAGGRVLPRPGLSLADDQGDIGEGQSIPPYYQHPLDFTGQGTSQSGPKAVAWATPAGGADPANRWIKYSKYADNNPSVIQWGQAAGLMANSITQGLGDDPYEVITYPTDNRDFDSLFSAEELLFLMLNNSEVDKLNLNSRLANLLPFNFDKKKGTNSRAEYIRRKFTVSSNDRKSFSLPVSPRSGNEYNLDANTNTLKFPPQFGSVSRYSTAPLAEDPFRPSVRYMMEIEINGQQNTFRPQRKLSLNGLLTGDSQNPLAFRPLTSHPDDPGTTPITTIYTPTSMPAYPPKDAPSQEFWARRDRQQLARDIYVLLYLVGHGVDTVNTTTTGAYTPAQCAEMAQFAVNLVDAMDRDSVITRFEYDVDLSNGWNLDDDPYTSPSTTPPVTETDRAEVYGVERLDLSISETMIIRTAAISPAANHDATFYDDSAQHHFAYAELYNQSPFDVNLTNNETWQLVMKQPGAFERRLSFKSGANKIPSGQRFTVGSADADLGGMAPGKSIFKLDPNWVSGTPDFTMSATWIAPYQKQINSGATKGLDLIDVVAPTTAFRVEDGATPASDLTGTVGSFAAALSTADPTKPTIFQLRRRAHPTRSYLSSSSVNDNDNPWVVVDEMTLPTFGTFTLATAMDDKTKIQMALNAVNGSKERFEPFGVATENQKSPNSMGNNNTLSNVNTNAVNPFTVWQPHFDRDYASIIELFNVPVISPGKMTRYWAEGVKAPENQTTPYSGAAYFLNPNTAVPNRWHRLLEFVEIPTRMNKNLGVGTEFTIPRVPGRMNLNTLRYTENFAALLDDPRYFSLDMSGVTAGKDQPPTMPDATGEARDWWSQFLASRDAVDFYAANNSGITMHLPGLPGSKPFRSLADVSYTASGGTKTASVEDTILRSLPIDSKRRLLEVGNSGEHTANSIDPIIRHRLLAKIAGNTTTRSNCFAIFISVKYFSAGADPAYNGAIRIGGPYNGKAEPEHRGFFVVDRSKLEQGKYTGSANYDFRAFIDFRKTIQTQ